MKQGLTRPDGRKLDQMRSVKATYDVYGYASGSVLFELGNTKVLCAVSISQGVPHFLKGKRVGWLTAEYALLPTSTQIRSMRDSSQMKKNERSVEISRLIGRSLRTVVDLNMIGERTIFIDCDVLQADGGTRTAAITGAFLALQKAEQVWLDDGTICQPIILDRLAAISVGWGNGNALLDINYEEDCTLDADYNFVLTGSDQIIEIQGTAEQRPLPWDGFDRMMQLARKGTKHIFEQFPAHSPIVSPSTMSEKKERKKEPGLFSLKNRLSVSS